MGIQQIPEPSSTGLTYRSGPTTARPSSPTTGENFYNTTNNALEIYNGTAWVNLIVPASAPIWNSPAENTTLATGLDQTAFSYSSFSVTDPQSNTITWSASSLPTGLSINTSNGSISGTVTTGITTTTTYNINVFATDTGGNISGRRFNFVVQPTIVTDFLVIAGGGGATSAANNNQMGGAGGGAGGYRTSAGTSGANSAAEATLKLGSGTAYSIRVGAGGAVSTNGSDSVFSTITSTGGGLGGISNLQAGDGGVRTGGTGGSGGGAGGSQYSPFYLPGLGTANQGRDGGGPQQRSGGGGGGASAVGGLGVGGNPPTSGGAGGAGLASTITGSSVTRAGGGGGSCQNGTGGAGGAGGGGAGGNNGVTGTAGTANTGGGGGGGSGNGSLAGGAGGSGIVIISIPNTFTASFSGGVTSASTSTGGKNVYIVTAAGTSDTVTFS